MGTELLCAAPQGGLLGKGWRSGDARLFGSASVQITPSHEVPEPRDTVSVCLLHCSELILFQILVTSAFASCFVVTVEKRETTWRQTSRKEWSWDTQPRFRSLNVKGFSFPSIKVWSN